MPTEQFANNAITTLASAISSGATSLSVASASGFPSSAQYRIRIDNELLLVTAGAGTTTWTVTRGIEGTTAAAHDAGAVVTQVLTAAGLAQGITDRIGSGLRLLAETYYTSAGSGTHTTAAGCTLLVVEAVGGGGGGGGADGNTSQVGVGRGGGGGAWFSKKYASPGASFGYTVGAAGTAGAAGNNAGGSGGGSIWDTGGTPITAGGGNGGSGGAAGTSISMPDGTSGGSVSGSVDLAVNGGTGGTAIRLSGTQGLCGYGGSSRYGAGGKSLGSSSAGAVGTGYGGGGSGGNADSTTDRAGGAGAAGLIIVREYGT